MDKVLDYSLEGSRDLLQVTFHNSLNKINLKFHLSFNLKSKSMKKFKMYSQPEFDSQISMSLLVFYFCLEFEIQIKFFFYFPGVSLSVFQFLFLHFDFAIELKQ